MSQIETGDILTILPKKYYSCLVFEKLFYFFSCFLDLYCINLRVNTKNNLTVNGNKKMFITNYHTHSHYDDGIGDIEDYVIHAIKNKMYAIGFSCHSPVPFDSVWNMKYEKLLNYVIDVGKVKKKYKDQIKIYNGIEADFIEDLLFPDTFQNFGFEYVIGAVHYVGRFENGTYSNLDTSSKIYREGLEQIYENDIKKAVRAYYNAIATMVTNHKPDVVAHFDIINKFNQYKQKDAFFDESENWYRLYALEALEAVKQSGCLIEINTRNCFKKLSDFFYPNTWIIEKCRDMKIPLIFSADAHSAEQLTSYHNEVIDLLRKIGVNEIFYFDEKGWQPQGIIN